MLEIQNLSVGYPDKNVISDLNLALPEGSLTAIVGPNGCGKSTLLKAVTGLLPWSGSITFGGQSLGELDSRQRGKLLAFLPQSRPVPEITAEKLVLHGRFPYLSYPRRYRQEDKAAAQVAMAQLGISQLSDRFLPTLSGGERQKVYLAMLLAQGTPIVIMDEPTTYLDISHKFELLQIARQMAAQGKTVIMVLHDLELAMNFAHRVAVMEQGRICQWGTPAEIAESGSLERIFHVRLGKAQDSGETQYYFLPHI